jgi:hypothetical protein
MRQRSLQPSQRSRSKANDFAENAWRTYDPTRPRLPHLTKARRTPNLISIKNAASSAVTNRAKASLWNEQCQWVVLSVGQIGLEEIMTRSARIGLTAALLMGGATIAMAQNGPPTGGYPPARWNPNFYGHYGHYHRYYAYYPVYPTVAGYWDYYRTSWPGRGNDLESTR